MDERHNEVEVRGRARRADDHGALPADSTPRPTGLSGPVTLAKKA
ncbi:hypothetical protein [Microbacterium testaceum]|nr:hypothetical protein [Microbacterium testaceum]